MISTKDARDYGYSVDQSIEAGIYENVRLEPIRTKRTNAGKAVIEWGFILDDGREILSSDFEPNRYPGSTDEEWARTQKYFLIRLTSISDLFSKFDASGETYSDLMEDYAEKLKAEKSRQTTLLRIVLVWDRKGSYLQIPSGINSGKNTFMERMDTENSKIKENLTHNLARIGERAERLETKGTEITPETKEVTMAIDELPF